MAFLKEQHVTWPSYQVIQKTMWFGVGVIPPEKNRESLWVYKPLGLGNQMTRWFHIFFIFIWGDDTIWLAHIFQMGWTSPTRNLRFTSWRHPPLWLPHVLKKKTHLSFGGVSLQNERWSRHKTVGPALDQRWLFSLLGWNICQIRHECWWPVSTTYFHPMCSGRGFTGFVMNASFWGFASTLLF